MLSTKPQFDTAVAEATEASRAYYDASLAAQSGEELMSDAAFDDLVGRIEIALVENPQWKSSASDAVFLTVAGGASIGGDVTHPEPMLSLSKAPTFNTVTEFIRDLDGRVVVEPKLDGLAIRAVYSKGNLKQVVTRGDGNTGEDVTSRVVVNGISRVTGLPTNVLNNESFEVRGEVYLSATDFATANINRTAAGKEAFANPRNAAAGALRKENATYLVPMSFAAYDVSGDAFSMDSYAARTLSLVVHFGIPSAHSLLGAEMNLAHDELIDYLGQNKNSLGFPIDGCVVKADLDADRVRLGFGSRHPKWAIAFKYAADTSTTVIQDIEFGLGRTGRLSIRARVEPVSVGGTTITYASLHNVGWLERNDIRIGDTVSIKRANDVIPYVESPDLELRPSDSMPWIAPTACPDCGEPFDKSTELWRCTTPECSTLGRIVYAASRDCLDIEGMSTAVATSLVESGRVTSIADLFTLTESELSELVLGTTKTGSPRRLGNANAVKIIAEIDKAKTQPLNRIITSLGLRKTGRTMGRRLAAEFGTMEAFRAASVTQLCNVEGIADGKAESIFSELAKMSDVIDSLTAAGVSMGSAAETTSTSSNSNPLAGMKVVVTGKVTGPMAGKSRNEVNELIEANGGKSSGSVSTSTNLLVCSEPGSSKYLKAVELGITIITPEEFADMISA